MFESEEDEDDDAALVKHRKRSSTLSSSGTPVPTTPLLLQGGGGIFAAIVPPLRSSVGLGGFMKKKIAKPLPSLNPQSTSYQSSGAPLHSESWDSECAVDKVAVRGTGFSGDPAAADLLAPEVTVAVVVEPSEEVAGASQVVRADRCLGNLRDFFWGKTPVFFLGSYRLLFLI
ncbi:uncharacterized protein [Miscanthus floridulus]|uniref:uncharacterized protein n=1 Tax=Miscanthus floridulus TaxID=154761 RepID=UPI003457DB31